MRLTTELEILLSILSIFGQFHQNPRGLRDAILFRIVRSCIILAFFLISCSQPVQQLPRALYYLDGSDMAAQVWRLERDGVSRQLVSHEQNGVQDFSVSSVNGSLALVSNNSLTVMDAKGRNRYLVIEAQLGNSLESQYRNTVANPLFSPDGRMLAYALNGIHLYDLVTGSDAHVVVNPGKESNDALSYATGRYQPVAWSPDGNQLLISMSYYEGYQLAVIEPGSQQAPLLLAPGEALCCQFSWSADGGYILVANPLFGGTIPGLWIFDAQTGVQISTISGHPEGGLTNFVGWPYSYSTGKLAYFLESVAGFTPLDTMRYSLVYKEQDVDLPKMLRSEEFSLKSALWSPDGSFVLIVGNWEDEGIHLAIVRPGTGALKVLIEDANLVRDLYWGP